MSRKHSTSIHSKVETVHEIILKPDLSPFFCVFLHWREHAVVQCPGHAAPGTSASPLVYLWCRTEVATALVPKFPPDFYAFTSRNEIRVQVRVQFPPQLKSSVFTAIFQNSKIVAINWPNAWLGTCGGILNVWRCETNKNKLEYVR